MDALPPPATRKLLYPFGIVVFASLLLVLVRVQKDAYWLHSVATAFDASTASKKPHAAPPGARNEQRVVVLPGPHKTGTTTVQNSLVRWTRGSPKLPGFDNWTYPVPASQDFESVQAQSWGEIKGFHPMVAELLNASQTPHDYLRNPLLQIYRRSIRRAWNGGKNIVIASETFDALVNEPLGMNPELLWERFLQLLPSAHARSNMIIGIHYRTPRIDQLISLWHEVGKPGESLVHYILIELTKNSFVLNPLGLANFFVQRGYTVRIIDTGRVVKAGELSVPSAVACYILQVPEQCSSADGEGKSRTEIRHNRKSDPGERMLNNETLQAINQLMVDYDCQYRGAWDGKPNVEWIYGETAQPSTSFPALDCSNNNAGRTFSQTVQAVVKLVYDLYPDAKDSRP